MLVNVCVGISNMVLGCVPPMVGCKCWAFLTWFLDVFLPWSDISVGRAFLTWFIPWSDISVEDDEDLHGG